LPILTHLFLNLVGRLLTFTPNSYNIESLSFKSRRRCPIDVGIEVKLFLIEFNWTIVNYKPTATKELSPSIGLDLEAKSCIRRQAGNDEKRLVLVGVQTEATGQVTAMVVARIERKLERLCAGDEFQEVGYVVQKGLRARRHLKDLGTKMRHLFVRVLGGSI
jgi:hypothetical protein